MKNVYVTQPSMPPLNEFISYLEKIWETKKLTNNGQYHKEFEVALCKYLGVKYISLFCNGTIALLTALKALQVKGEVITTPFSFVATAHSIKWNDLKPVFIDIEPDTFNLDPGKIESAITDKTSAVMPVHVYGNPCDVNRIQQIADKHKLKVVFDAAHAFGVKKNGTSILNYGDLSVLSFHATKAYNTFEGGAIISHDKETKDRIDKLKNFGFLNETTVIETGINGKMNELQTAFGLLYLKYVDKYIEKRKKIALRYRELLKDVNGIKIMNEMPGITYNYSYFPILIDGTVFGRDREEIYNMLKEKGICTRRYFYPLITDFPMYKTNTQLKVAKKIAEQILCLPIYPDLIHDDVKRIVSLIRDLI